MSSPHFPNQAFHAASQTPELSSRGGENDMAGDHLLTKKY